MTRGGFCISSASPCALCTFAPPALFPPQVLSYTGQLVNTIAFECLFEAAWLPVAPGTFTDRPMSPERITAGAKGGAGGHKGAGGERRGLTEEWLLLSCCS